MIVVDTTVISELTRQAPAPEVVSWLDSLAADDVATTAVTAAELLYGVGRLPDGRRKIELSAAVHGLLSEDFHGRAIGATLATRNTDDFDETGIDLINPWKLT